MKGLLYKEWCLGKRGFLLFLILALLFSVLGVLVCLSLQFGNLKDMGEDIALETNVLAQVFFYVPYLILLGACSRCLQTIYLDYDSGWMKYSYTFPLEVQKEVGVRYLVGGFCFLFALLYSLVNCAVISALSKISFTVETLKNQLLLLTLVCLLFAFFLPLAMHFKSAKPVSTIAIAVLAVVYMGTAAGMYVMMELNGTEAVTARGMMEKLEKLRDGIFPFFPVILILGVLMSFLCSCRIYKRREKA
jgi:hypothetical protein